MTNSEYFADGIGLIHNGSLRAFATKYCDLFPDYFADKPASSTGKYHPAWSNTVGGLRKHTKAVMYLCDALHEAYCLGELERDAAIVAALGHDAVKYGIAGGKFTTSSHAAEGAMFFKRVAKALNAAELPLIDKIEQAIADHMGVWGEYQEVRRFPATFSRISQLVHVADMCASRKEVRFNFLEEMTIA